VLWLLILIILAAILAVIFRFLPTWLSAILALTAVGLSLGLMRIGDLDRALTPLLLCILGLAVIPTGSLALAPALFQGRGRGRSNNGKVPKRKKQKKNKKIFDELIQKVNAYESEMLKQLDIQEEAKEIVIDDEKIDKVLKGLMKLEQQEYYLRLDCNLRSVAKKVKTNATYLSKIINKHHQKNFNEYINDLRIDYALRRIKNDRKFRSFSVKSIATEIGYKSDYSFAKHFKAKTGLNPSYYIKNIQKQEELVKMAV